MRLIISLLTVVSASMLVATDLSVYEDTLRDHCWMWGHDSGYYDGTGPGSVYNLPLSEPITMPDACAYMGIPNVCAITWGKPSDEYLKPFAKMKRVSWVVCGAIGSEGGRSIDDRYYRLRDQDFELVGKLPNLVGLELDDYFRYKSGVIEKYIGSDGKMVEVCASGIGHTNLVDLVARLDKLPRKLNLRLVHYIDRTEGKSPALFAPAIDLVDAITAWTWTGDNIAKLGDNMRKCRQIVPNKRILMGIYMWDFGGKKPLDMNFMRKQLDIAHELYMAHVVDGFIFHCTPLVNKHPAIEAVEYAREWIRLHGDDHRQ